MTVTLKFEIKKWPSRFGIISKTIENLLSLAGVDLHTVKWSWRDDS